jgi:hypothetical protein
MDALRPFIARLLAAGLASFFAWLAGKWGITVDEQTREATVVAIQGFVMLALYGVLHKVFNIKLNPLDAARATVSKPEAGQIVKAQTQAMIEHLPHKPVESYDAETLDRYRTGGGGFAPPDAPRIPDDNRL